MIIGVGIGMLRMLHVSCWCGAAVALFVLWGCGVLLATRIVLCNYELGRGRDEIMLVIVLEVCEHDKPVRVFDAASGTTTWVMKEHNTLRMR